MSNSDAAWGIEVGACAIKAVRLERNGVDVRVTDFSVIPHKKVLTTPDLDQDEMIRLGLGQFISQKSLEGEQLVMSVPGHAAFARFAKLPPVEAKKVPDIVKFEAVQQIPFPIEEVEWDYETFTSDDSPETEVGIFAMTRERVQERLHLYGDLSISPERLNLSPVSVFNAMSYDLDLGDKPGAVMFLDIGTQATDVIIAEEGRCWIRTFPLGGTHFTEAIAEAFKLNYSKAEKLKLEASSSKYTKQIMQAMRPVFSDLLQDLQRSIGYYQSLHADSDIETVIGLGSTFKIPGLRKFIGQQLQVNVTRLDEYKKISVAGREAASFAEHAVNFGTAYGLALQGVGLGAIDANLMPVNTLREQMWHAKTKWFAIAAAIMILAALTQLIRPTLDSQALKAGAGANSSFATVQQNGDELKSRHDSIAATANQGAVINNMNQLLDNRTVWPYLVHDAADALQSTEPQPELESTDLSEVFSIPANERRLVHLDNLDGAYEFRPDEQNKRLIHVTLNVELSHTNPTMFLNSTVANWLRENAEPTGDRADVPYRILPDTISINPQALETFEASEDGAERQNSGSSGGANRPGGNTGGSGRPGFSAGDDDMPEQVGGAGSGGMRRGGRSAPRRSAPGKGGMSGGGGESAGGTAPPAGGQRRGGNNQPSRQDPNRPDFSGGNDAPQQGTTIDLQSEAPIPSRPRRYQAGEKFFRLPITFTLELVDPNAAPGANTSNSSADRGENDNDDRKETLS